MVCLSLFVKENDREFEAKFCKHRKAMDVMKYTRTEDKWNERNIETKEE